MESGRRARSSWVAAACVAAVLVAGCVALAVWWHRRPAPVTVRIEYVCALRSEVDLRARSLGDWFIITGPDQHRHWRESGLALPPCDFGANYLIVSSCRMTSLAYIPGDNSCCTGVPDGHAILDRHGSKPGELYIYRMPRVRLSEGVG